MTKTLRRIEVEPLPGPRWSKIEQGLFSRLERMDDRVFPPIPERRTSALRLWLLAAALGSLAVIALVVSGFSDPAVVDQPSRITTGSSGSHLALPGLSLDVEPQSAVVIDAETQRGQLIVLDRGTIVCQVAPRSSAAPLIVQAGATRVRVIGTRFRVTRYGEAAHVQVQQGTVEVTSRGKSWRVDAGQEWRPMHADGPTAEGAHAATEVSAHPQAAPPLAQPAPDASGTQRALGEGPQKPTVEQRAAERARPERGASARTRRNETGGSIAELAPTVATPDPSRQTVFERATALERRDPARASELYRSLEAGRDSWAQNALYARARLAASRGNADDARRLLQHYLDRFPRGSNAEDARAVLRRLR